MTGFRQQQDDTSHLVELPNKEILEWVSFQSALIEL